MTSVNETVIVMNVGSFIQNVEFSSALLGYYQDLKAIYAPSKCPWSLRHHIFNPSSLYGKPYCRLE